MNSNPILTERALKNIDYSGLKPMTLENTFQKFFILMIPFLLAAGAMYYQYVLQHNDFVNLATTISMFAGLIIAFIIFFKPRLTMYFAPVYAFCEGAFLSGMSCFVNNMYPGIVIQAVVLTILAAVVCAVLYMSRIIKVTERFRSVVVSATIAIAIFYLIALVLIFGFHKDIPLLYSSSPIGIGFSIFVCILACANLLLDYNFIERAIVDHAPEEFGWYAAFGLMVTLVWLYIEVLRLLQRFARR